MWRSVWCKDPLSKETWFSSSLSNWIWTLEFPESSPKSSLDLTSLSDLSFLDSSILRKSLFFEHRPFSLHYIRSRQNHYWFATFCFTSRLATSGMHYVVTRRAYFELNSSSNVIATHTFFFAMLKISLIFLLFSSLFFLLFSFLDWLNNLQNIFSSHRAMNLGNTIWFFAFQLPLI